MNEINRYHQVHLVIGMTILLTSPCASALGQVVALPTPMVSVSSQNTSTGQLGVKAIDGVIDGYPHDYTREWATRGQLAGAWIQFNWSSPVQVSRIVLWDRPNMWDNVQAGTLSFSDGTTLPVGQLPGDASSGYTVSFTTKSVTSVRFTVTRAAGVNIGLAEIQLFGSSSGAGAGTGGGGTGGGGTGGRVPFTRIVIDQNPPVTVLEKGLADIDGDGRLDAIIGFGNPPGTSVGQGLAWYEFPHSGNPANTWFKHTIVPAPTAFYEDLKPSDMNGDGAVDIISSVISGWPNNPIYWYENPRGHGGDPRTAPWTAHLIGTGFGENNMLLADIDGDGKLDLVTNSSIFFQNSPTSWTRLVLSSTESGMTLLDIGSGRGAVNLVTLSQTSAGAPFVWRENPREHGGNARTDPWIVHVVGPGYNLSGGRTTYATGDFNKDGRLDFTTAWAEGPCTNTDVLWWEAPADRRTGTWLRHVIDSTYQCVHNLRTADMDGDGNIDIIGAEQEESAQKRLTIFYGDGRGNFTQQILSTSGGHSEVVGDVTGDGKLDILNANHGYDGAAHPIELYLNQR
jgi:hypothetical protein